MSDDGKTVDITLLGRQYRVSCAEGEEKQLAAAVEFLDGKLQEIQGHGKVFGSDRLILMAALNIANEFLTLRSSGKGLDLTDFRRRIRAMEDRLERSMFEQEKLF